MITSEHPEMMEIHLTVNGRDTRRRVPTHLRLLDFLRDHLGLTAAKDVCGEGECGACTVLLDGNPVNSCLIFAVEADGADITTVEGLDAAGESNEIFEAYLDEHAVQCGYCIPGLIVMTEATLRENSHPTRDEIKHQIAGNICRCTGYAKLMNAVEAAGKNRP
jgi:aerobic-type carbon monoxide dehydrogenase small subunit (CoxS/CutS family)